MRRAPIVLLAATTAMTMSCSDPVAPPRLVTRSSTTTVAATTTTTPAPAIPKVTADAVRPDPRVGAIFLGGTSVHTCTGSVLDSAAGDLILTAAHCMAAGYDVSFIPGFAVNAEPQNFWRIDQVYLDPRWVATEDPMADFAIARVVRDDGGAVEAAAGGGFAIGSGPDVGTDVTVTGYALGVGGDPIGCSARTTALDRGFPSLPCPGLVDGTSGSPWMTGSTVVGVVGGLEGGGCDENVSYTPPFDGAVKRLVARAEVGGAGDAAPAVSADAC